MTLRGIHNRCTLGPFYKKEYKKEPENHKLKFHNTWNESENLFQKSFERKEHDLFLLCSGKTFRIYMLGKERPPRVPVPAVRLRLNAVSIDQGTRI